MAELGDQETPFFSQAGLSRSGFLALRKVSPVLIMQILAFFGGKLIMILVPGLCPTSPALARASLKVSPYSEMNSLSS